MCTLLLRYEPGARWPILAAAVRDEFVGRPWDPPGAHWDTATTDTATTDTVITGTAIADTATTGASSTGGFTGRHLLGGRDRVAGGTWLAVDPDARAFAAVLNGERLPPPASGERPSRGGLPLAALRPGSLPNREDLTRYDGFHLVRADLDGVRVMSWDGTALLDRTLRPGDHIVVNRGIEVPDDPVVAHFLPLLANTPSPDPGEGPSERSGEGPSGYPGSGQGGVKSTVDAWGRWVDLVAGDGLDPTALGALLIRREFDGRRYGSTSVSLVALSPGAVRYDFSGSPWEREAWRPVLAGADQ